jgi:hypothetical protein
MVEMGWISGLEKITRFSKASKINSNSGSQPAVDVQNIICQFCLPAIILIFK